MKDSSSWTSIKRYSSALPVSPRLTGRTWRTTSGAPKSPPITAPSPIGPRIATPSDRNADRTLLQRAPGFDKAHWPNMADLVWGAEVSAYYGAKPYWT